MTNKPTRGGKRAGSGRKRRAIPVTAITVRLEPNDADKLKSECKERKISQAKYITEKINQ